METFQTLLALRALVSSYRTYEEWKRVCQCLLGIIVPWFLPYLWGMETEKCNGNGKLNECSYRTYEEWKHPYVILNAAKQEFVLTVPMRNGNPVNPAGNSKHFPVLTVPMRNGNVLLRLRIFQWCRFLPYLWGMETFRNALPRMNKLGSYRTYEEWKPM